MYDDTETVGQVGGIKLTRFPRTCYLSESHEFTLSVRSATVTVTLRRKYLIDFFQNITETLEIFIPSRLVRGERYYTEDPVRGKLSY